MGRSKSLPDETVGATGHVISRQQFQVVARAGGVDRVILEGVPDGFVMRIQTRRTDYWLTATGRSDAMRRVRVFADPRTAFEILQEFGINRVEVRLDGWTPA